MANLNEALNKALANEGATNKKLGYNNTPRDRGGETVAGIARNMNPGWQGWALVDRHKKDANFPYSLKQDATLLQLINSFYKTEFWDKVGGDAIDNQAIADELMDTAINNGVAPALSMAGTVLGTWDKGNTIGHINDLA